MSLRLGEFHLIDEFVAAFSSVGGAATSLRSKSLLIGPGDDCAVLAPEKDALCVTTDAVVEDVHFSRPAFSLEDIGHKALAVNLSDLAAMGAKPSWFVCALASPKSLRVEDVRALARGMAPLARLHRIGLAGGNFTRARELSVTITAAGTVPKGKALLRKDARPGDLLYVSGTLGDAARTLENPSRADRQRRPIPRVTLGLIARRFAHACIDVSDGFAQDLGHVVTASFCRAAVEVAKLPLSQATRKLGSRGLQLALSGGEDYELIIAVPKERARAFERACMEAGEKVTLVGRFERGVGVALVDATGRTVRSRPGHDHFIDAPVRGG